MKKFLSTEVVIIGGGLAGIFAAIRLSKANIRCILLDDCIPEAKGVLGGFAAFSGAKFSLPPAGMGLASLVGSKERLNEKIAEVIEYLEMGQRCPVTSFDENILDSTELGKSVTLRRYHSILLTPTEIRRLLEKLTRKIEKECLLIRSSCQSLSRKTTQWQVIAYSDKQSDEFYISSNAVFFAGGRLSSEMLINAGAIPTTGKGLDIGIRIEAMNVTALSGLRRLGPDAKIIQGNCRTFCLNVPGLIHYYPFKNISIPGGIVADDSINRSNVGLLVRINEKNHMLQQIINNIEEKSELLEKISYMTMSSPPFGQIKENISKVLGSSVTEQLQDFCQMLGKHDLIDWSLPYKIHLPLIDWHWQTFAKPNTHETSLEGVYVMGDSSGHARGLLQAAVSGWIAAEEYMQ